MDTPTLDALLDLVHEGWHSLCQQTGGAFHGAVMAEDGLMILENGFVLTGDVD